MHYISRQIHVKCAIKRQLTILAHEIRNHVAEAVNCHNFHLQFKLKYFREQTNRINSLHSVYGSPMHKYTIDRINFTRKLMVILE